MTNARKINSEEDEAIFYHQKSMQYQTAETAGFTKNEVTIIAKYKESSRI
jgi:hypothetical protein